MYVHLTDLLFFFNTLLQVKSWSIFWSSQKRAPSGLRICHVLKTDKMPSLCAKTCAKASFLFDPKNKAREN